MKINLELLLEIRWAERLRQAEQRAEVSTLLMNKEAVTFEMVTEIC